MNLHKISYRVKIFCRVYCNNINITINELF